jgi:flagellar assembly protein FliH
MSNPPITKVQEYSQAELGKSSAYQTWKIPTFNTENISIHASKSIPKLNVPDDENISRIFEDARQEAYEKGMQEGFTVGLANARSVADEDKDFFLQLMNNFTDALEQADEKIAGDVLALALDIAKAMLKVKLQVDPAVVLPIVADAIHYLPYIQQPARILLHRDDAQMLREYLTDDIHHWQIQEDAHIERGGCMVDTGANHIDVSNVQRWKRISDALAQHNDWLLT